MTLPRVSPTSLGLTTMVETVNNQRTDFDIVSTTSEKLHHDLHVYIAAHLFNEFVSTTNFHMSIISWEHHVFVFYTHICMIIKYSYRFVLRNDFTQNGHVTVLQYHPHLSVEGKYMVL